MACHAMRDVKAHFNGRPLNGIELVICGDRPVHQVGVQVLHSQLLQRLLAGLPHTRMAPVVQLPVHTHHTKSSHTQRPPCVSCGAGSRCSGLSCSTHGLEPKARVQAIHMRLLQRLLACIARAVSVNAVQPPHDRCFAGTGRQRTVLIPPCDCCAQTDVKLLQCQQRGQGWRHFRFEPQQSPLCAQSASWSRSSSTQPMAACDSIGLTQP